MSLAPGTYRDLPAGLDPLYIHIYEVALPMLGIRKNDLHARISCQFTVEFLEREGGDPRIAIPAILLHDLGWNEIPEEQQRRAYGPNSTDAHLNRLHEQAGARLAREVLESIGYDGTLIDEICRIVDGHDSRPTAASVEEAIVKDSDKVWRVSREGFPVNLIMLADLAPQQLHDFIAVRVPIWFLTTAGREMVLQQLADRRAQYELNLPPDILPPAGYGIGDVEEYDAAEREVAVDEDPR
jgi:HD domain